MISLSQALSLFSLMESTHFRPSLTDCLCTNLSSHRPNRKDLCDRGGGANHAASILLYANPV
ncbi:hypothetical protein TIFTF001_027812 [Ficus carica]|uniref:Uncharacterized protein n=1 Tax=Ficus carica TaxID=3494 RepID=A0AA88IVM6_FICCA|nr:hypothetical protein TIFTF001_027812 [Ficus carica]